MIVRRLVIIIASVVMTLGLLAFALGRVLLGIAGSADAVGDVVVDVIELPAVRDALADEIVEQIANDDQLVQYVDEDTIRTAVNNVLSTDQLQAVARALAEGAYAVFIEGDPEAEIGLDGVVSVAVAQLADITAEPDLAVMAAEYGVDPAILEDLDPSTVAAIEDAIAVGSAAVADTIEIEPITLERTADDPDLSSLPDTVRFLSNLGLALAIGAAVVMLAVSPVLFLRRFLSLGIVAVVVGVVLLIAANASSLIPTEDAPRPEVVSAIADDLFARFVAPAVTMLVLGVVAMAVGIGARFVPQRRRRR